MAAACVWNSLKWFYFNMEPRLCASLNPVYTIQPVGKPVWQPVEYLFTRCSPLFNHGCQTLLRLNNRLFNRLNVCIHDTTGCSSGYQTGLNNRLYRVNGVLLNYSPCFPSRLLLTTVKHLEYWTHIMLYAFTVFNVVLMLWSEGQCATDSVEESKCVWWLLVWLHY